MATGSFTDRKGTISLVAAMQMLLDEGLPCSLVVSGMDIDRGAIRKQLSAHQHLNEKLFFPGYLSDAEMFQAYGSAARWFTPRWTRASACHWWKRPTWAAPSLPAILKSSGETSGGEAFFFENGDAGKIAEGLRKWFALTRKKQLKFVPAKSLVTWRQSAAMLTEIMFQGAACFALDVGVRASMNLVVPGPAGHLAQAGRCAMTFEEASGKYSLFECIQLTEANYQRSRPAFMPPEDPAFADFLAQVRTGKASKPRGRIACRRDLLAEAKPGNGCSAGGLRLVRSFLAMSKAGGWSFFYWA